MPNHVVGQTTAFSCGAACLLCAALELGTAPTAAGLPATEPFSQLVGLGQALAATNAWLTAIYRISAGGGDGYSLPSNVIRAAAALGMTANVVMAATKTVKFLQTRYPAEIQACLNNTIPVASPRLGDLVLAANQRAMHCVAIGKTGAVHWVMQRPDNTYMDPAGGAVEMDIAGGGGDRTTRATLKSTGQKALGITLEYHGTGLAIRLQR